MSEYEGVDVASTLIDLKIQVDDLDQERFDLDAVFVALMLGYLPGIGTPLKLYLSRYETAST